jgi:hypothetical protein
MSFPIRSALGCLLAAIFLYGCTVPTIIFVKNGSGTDQELFFTSRFLNTIDTFRYTLLNEPISRKRTATWTDQLLPTILSDSVFSITIPAGATVLIDRTFNLNAHKYTSITFKGTNLIQERFIYNVDSSERTHQGFTFFNCYRIR